MNKLTEIAMATRIATSTYAMFGPGVLVVMAVLGIAIALAIPPTRA